MFSAEYFGHPRPAERPRARFSSNNSHYYLYTPPLYAAYKEELIAFFDQFANNTDLKELFDTKKIIFGLSIKIIFKLKGRISKNNNNPFYGMRPDIDNLYKAVVDSLFQSSVNTYPDGFEQNKDGSPIVDENDVPILHFRQKIDDSRVIHTELLKLKVADSSEEGFKIIIKNVGKESIN